MKIQDALLRGNNPSSLFIATSLALMACTARHEPAAGPIGTTRAALGVRDPTNGFFQDSAAGDFSMPVISSRGENTLDVFKLSAGLMYQRSVDNGAWEPTWRPLPPLQAPHTLVGEIAAVSWDATRIDVFAGDEAGNINHNWSNYGNWNPSWEVVANLPGCATVFNVFEIGCMMTVASWGPGRLDVLAAYPTDPADSEQDTAIWQITYDNGWQPPRQPFTIGNNDDYGFTGISAVSWGPNRIDLVAATDQGDFFGGDPGPREPVRYWTDDGTQWFGPEGLGQINRDDFGTNYPWFSSIALTSWGPDILNVVTTTGFYQLEFGFSTFVDTRVAQKRYRPTTGWQSWEVSVLPFSPFEFQDTRVAAVSWGPGRIDAVGTGSNLTSNFVEHYWSNESPPVGWFGEETLSTFANPSCLDGWRDNTGCASLCLSRTQSDEAACQWVLDCYDYFHCGPGTCDTSDDRCGPNGFGVGDAPYPFAQQVFNCIPGCSN
jgi:hypothetical protein